MADSTEQNPKLTEQVVASKGVKGVKGVNAWLAHSILRPFALLAALLAGGIFVVVVTIVATRRMSKPLWLREQKVEILQRKELNYAYTTPLNFEGRTNNKELYIYTINLVFGYEAHDTQLEKEFEKRSLEVQDLLRGFFACKALREYAPENEEKLKQQLLEKVNKFLKTGKVKEILFLEKTVG